MSTYTPTGPCDWCEEAATAVVLDPFALAGHSLACVVHAAEHYGAPA